MIRAVFRHSFKDLVSILMIWFNGCEALSDKALDWFPVVLIFSKGFAHRGQIAKVNRSSRNMAENTVLRGQKCEVSPLHRHLVI